MIPEFFEKGTGVSTWNAVAYKIIDKNHRKDVFYAFQRLVQFSFASQVAPVAVGLTKVWVLSGSVSSFSALACTFFPQKMIAVLSYLHKCNLGRTSNHFQPSKALTSDQKRTVEILMTSRRHKRSQDCYHVGTVRLKIH